MLFISTDMMQTRPSFFKPHFQIATFGLLPLLLLANTRLPAQGVFKVGSAQRSVVPDGPYCWRGAKTHALLTTIWYPADAASVEQTLEYIARCAPGTATLFEFVVPFSTLTPMMQLAMEQVAQRLADRGEPWKSTFEPEALQRRLQAPRS